MRKGARRVGGGALLPPFFVLAAAGVSPMAAEIALGATAAERSRAESSAEDARPQETPSGGAVACPPHLEVLMARPLAASRGFEPGDAIELLPEAEGPACRATVVGVFEPRADPAALATERPRLLFHLPDLATLAGRSGEVDRFSLRLRAGALEGAGPAELAADLERLLPGARVLETEEVARRSSTTFEVVRRFHRAIGAITMVAGGAFLACIMILKVQERRTPVAALRLLGVSRRTLIGWVVAEAVIVSVLGGALGLALGWTASTVVNGFYQGAYETTLVFSRVTPRIALESLALALGLGVTAGVAAALRLFASDPLTEVGR